MTARALGDWRYALCSELRHGPPTRSSGGGRRGWRYFSPTSSVMIQATPPVMSAAGRLPRGRRAGARGVVAAPWSARGSPRKRAPGRDSLLSQQRHGLKPACARDGGEIGEVVGEREDSGARSSAGARCSRDLAHQLVGRAQIASGVVLYHVVAPRGRRGASRGIQSSHAQALISSALMRRWTAREAAEPSGPNAIRSSVSTRCRPPSTCATWRCGPVDGDSSSPRMRRLGGRRASVVELDASRRLRLAAAHRGLRPTAL